MKKLHLLLLASCLFFLHSCVVYKDVEVKEVLDVKLIEFSNQGADCEVYVTIYNPNWYKITLTESHVNLLFEGKSLGEVQLKEQVIIPKNSQSTITMKCLANYANMQDVLGNVLALLFKSEYVMEGNGYIKGKAMMVSKEVPVVFKETLTKADLGF